MTYFKRYQVSISSKLRGLEALDSGIWRLLGRTVEKVKFNLILNYDICSCGKDAILPDVAGDTANLVRG